MRRGRAWLAVAGVIAGTSLMAPGPTVARSVDYLYVESNEGGSSGGHVALRFGDRVFHFQYTGGGFLRVSRTSFDGFRRHYTLLENRTIHVARIPVSEETFDLLHDFFTRRRVIQHGYFQTLESLEDDRRLLEALRAAARGERGPPVVLEGAGYFFDAAEPSAPDPSPILRNLGARIAAAHGPDFLDRRLEQARAQLHALDPRTLAAPGLDLTDERAPEASYGFAQRYKDAMVAWRAIEVLREGRSLRPGTYASAPGGELVLREGEERLVDQLAESLAASLVRLVRSDRPDWGTALMVGLARLDALEKTRRTRAWVFLDVFALDAPSMTQDRLRREPEVLDALLREGQLDLDAARAQLLRSPAAPGFREIEFAELEASGNRAVEALRAAHEGRDLRVQAGRQPPSRSAPARALVVPAAILGDPDGHVAEAERRERQYAERLKQVYGYRLLTRNCVTEIFREIDLALARAAGGRAASAGESRQRLGGHLQMTGLRFIPAVSATAVADTYAVAEQTAIPSHRQARLARLYREAESPLRVFLRESNTLTSTVYRRNPDDSYFLFFTDDAIAARPLFGAVNLATGLGATVAGMATLPFDRGKTLWAGLKGVVFSLPELVFFNIRKGSFDYVRDDRGLE